MPSVFVVPLYVEMPEGFERAITTLEGVLQRAGYRFHTGAPLAATLDETKRMLRDVGQMQVAAAASGDELSVPPRHRIVLG